MTYLVLARKWRPRSFDTLVGQEHVVRALTHALSTQRLHHAWLFTGTRGVGKTTLSRILAKALNCETGITPAPCGVCRACTEIDAGRFVDYIELDAASNRGVEEMTQLLEQAVYSPSSGRFKVYMIDEVHMLTGHAFNAMLKTLEEPPEHVKFIIATTDPQKIPVTVLSRCLQFNLKQMTAESIVGHLQGILASENIGFEVPALRLLAKAAAGSMRDALSLTDQAIAYSAGNLTTDAIQGMLGTIDQGHLVQLLRALAGGDAPHVVTVANQLAERGFSYSGALADLAVLLSRIAIAQRVPGSLVPEDPLTPDLTHLAGVMHPDQVQLFYSVAVHSRQELSLAPDEYAGFIMACLRMLALLPPGFQAPVIAGPDAPGSAASHPATPVSAPTATTAVASVAPVTTSSVAIAPAAQAPQQGMSQQGSTAAPGSAHPVIASAVPVSESALRESTPEPAVFAAPTPPLPAASVDIPAWEDDPAAGLADSATDTAPPVTLTTDTVEATVIVAPDQGLVPIDVTVPAAASVVPAGEPGHALASAPESPADNKVPFSSEAAPQAEFVNEGNFFSADPSEFDGFIPDDESFEMLSMPALPKASAASGVSGSARTGRNPRLSSLTAKNWPELAARLPVTGLAQELARQSELQGVDDNATVRLRVAIRTLAESAAQTRLQTVLSEHFGTVVRLHIEYGITGDETAHAVAQAQRAALQKKAEEDAVNDPFIQDLVQQFDARIIPGSVRATSKVA
ncbi:MAG: DNA polymerase III subunit gamma/tau [Alcaligenaceae bacterium]|nr:DNA polymerase III subunit gamma/tau [Alcaligenaceae bacterium]